MKVLIYSKLSSKRLIYTLDVFIKQLIGIDYLLTNKLEDYLRSPLAKINYSENHQNTDELFLSSHSLLFQKSITTQKVKVKFENKLPYFFSTFDKTSALPFDLFAMSFYLISRYEEYLPFQKDAHQRFSAKESIATRFNFLQLPLVDLWAKRFKIIIQKRYPNLKFKQRQFQFLPTYDIDMAWAYQHKGMFRTVGASLRAFFNRDTSIIVEQWQVLIGRKPDPFFVFDDLKHLHEKYQLSPTWFFLMGQLSTFDKNTNVKNPAFQQLIRTISEQYEVGIHPSYASNEALKIVDKEKKVLEKIASKNIKQSRQHFLKLSFPKTYQNLLSIGIERDYSMGYADAIGFRASTASPFYWYDLKNEQPTNLKVYPFQVMDVTLRQYLNLSPDEAISAVKLIKEQCEMVDGVFCTLWHNSSFALPYWEGWARVYEEIIKFSNNAN